MRTTLEIMAEFLSVEQVHQLEEAVTTLRDLAKIAMTAARKEGQAYSARVAASAYKNTSRQVKIVQTTLRKREGT